jgi:nicotinamidase-related amidase
VTEKALLVIDVQNGFRDPVWGRRNNPGFEENIERLIAAWRSRRWPVVFVRHDSVEPGSPLAPGQTGNALQDVVGGEPDLLVAKHVNSAFFGEPDLHEWLQRRGLGGVVVSGITTNHCCETTARMAGNLGYETWFALDATFTFDRRDLGGNVISADELARVTAANLSGEFATVLSTAEILGG